MFNSARWLVEFSPMEWSACTTASLLNTILNRKLYMHSPIIICPLVISQIYGKPEANPQERTIFAILDDQNVSFFWRFAIFKHFHRNPSKPKQRVNHFLFLMLTNPKGLYYNIIRIRVRKGHKKIDVKQNCPCDGKMFRANLLLNNKTS